MASCSLAILLATLSDLIKDWLENGLTPSKASVRRKFRGSFANSGHLASMCFHALESTIDLTLKSLLSPSTCHVISSANRLYRYIRSNRGIRGKCCNTFTGMLSELGTYRNPLHSGHSFASLSSFLDKQWPFLHAFRSRIMGGGALG